MKKYFSKIAVLSTSIALPNITLAAGEESRGLFGIIAIIGKLFSAIVPILVALGIVYFVWGVINYVIADSEEAKQKGRDSIVFGVIGLAVILSVWGLVRMVMLTFNLDSSQVQVQNLQNLLPGSGATTNNNVDTNTN